MSPGDIYLNDVKIPDAARKVTPQVVEITRSNRTVAGTLVEDVVRVYTNYQIDYEMMTGPDRDVLINLYNLNKHLGLVYVRQDGSLDAQMVKMAFADGTRELCGLEWLWSGVSVLLEVV